MTLSNNEYLQWDNMLNGLDLFSGIGGISIALDEWVIPIAYCEIDPYCQGVLLSRIATGEIKNSPIWDDIKTLEGSRFARGSVDIIFGGFPCQGISVAGHGKGLDDERSGLFYEIVRLAKEIKPKFIFLENVPTISSRGGLRIIREIAQMGYDCRWCVISAASVGAKHRRERWFLLAHTNNHGSPTDSDRESSRERIAQGKGSLQSQKDDGEIERASGLSDDVADTGCECEKSKKKPEWPSLHFAGCNRFWKTEPELDRMADGIQFRVDRIRALGNAVVPQQAKEAFKILMGIKQ